MAFSLDELREGQVFIIDKPLDWTSFDVVKKIRYNIRKTHQLKKFKVGHAGTLDPKATGVLVICVGKFTKRITEFQSQTKTYRAKLKLGATTESYDTEQPEDQTFPIKHITLEKISKALKNFEGKITQIPPAHSAIKVNGTRVYKLARAGEEVEIPPREVHIHRIEILHFEMPFLEIEVVCEKGTYIRTLAHDIGLALDSGAYLTQLCRTQSGEFNLEKSDNAPLDLDFFKP